MEINKESDLKKLVETFGDLCLGKMDINGKKAFILDKNDSEVVVLEKYLGNGLQKIKYCFSDSNKPLRPRGKPEIIYEFHKDFDYFRSIYDGKITA
jgi:hypothetical protein